MKYLLYTTLIALVFATAFAENRNINLITNMNNYPSISYTDCWGYTAPNGKNYVLLGVNAGVSIVDVTDVNNIAEVDFIPFVNFGWYDMKTYQNYMYVSSEGATHILIVDLSPLPDSASIVGLYGNFATSLHNIYIDTEMDVLYAVEDFNFNRPVTLISLSDPENPAELSFLGVGLGTDAHDIFAQDSVLYVAEGINGSIGFFDVSNPASPALLQRLIIPSAGYVHNVWVSPDKKYMITTEETPEKTVKVWDIEDLNNISLLDEYLGESRIAHNAYFQGDFAYISHYQSGVKILDITDPSHIVEVGNYDTIEGEEPITFGNWGIFPFASNGLTYASDMLSGLYVLEFNNTLAYRVKGVLKDAVTAQPINNGWIEVIETGIVRHTNIQGEYKAGFGGSGPITLRAATFGYEIKEIPLTAVSGLTEVLDIELQLAPAGSVKGTVTNQSGDPVEGVSLSLTIDSRFFNQPYVLQTTTNTAGEYEFSGLPETDTSWVNYEQLELEKFFPYPAQTVSGITVSAASPTIIDFQLNPADLFLVNDDPGAAYMNLFLEALAVLNVVPFQWSTAIEGENIPVSSFGELNNNVLIWYTGDAEASVLSDTEQDSLAQFLEGGGRLFLTGKNIAEYLNNQGSLFLQNYLMVDYGGEASGPPLITPVSSNPVTGSLNVFSVAQTSKDILITATGGNADSAFTYFNGDLAGVTIENLSNSSKTVFLGFGFEEISPANRREEVMNAILSWFDVITGIDQLTGNTIPEVFELRQNYPNPFNPSTTIEYILVQQSRVILKVYNILGQEVRTLANEFQPAGEKSVVWNGRDDTGQMVSSGVYLYRLKAGNEVQTRKMVLLQ
jgi:choice-of-anchor B domain-containing protein